MCWLIPHPPNPPAPQVVHPNINKLVLRYQIFVEDNTYSSEIELALLHISVLGHSLIKVKVFKKTDARVGGLLGPAAVQTPKFDARSTTSPEGHLWYTDGLLGRGVSWCSANATGSR